MTRNQIKVSPALRQRLALRRAIDRGESLYSETAVEALRAIQQAKEDITIVITQIDLTAAFLAAGARLDIARRALAPAGMPTLDEQLAAAFLAFQRLVRAAPLAAPVDLERLGGYLYPRIDAVNALLAGEDNGERLQDAVRQDTGPAFAELFGWIGEHIDRGGRPRGISGWRYELAQRWAAHEAERPTAGARQVWAALVDELDGLRREGVLPDELQPMLDSLKGVKYGGEARYRRELLRAAKLVDS